MGDRHEILKRAIGLRVVFPEMYRSPAVQIQAKEPNRPHGARPTLIQSSSWGLSSLGVPAYENTASL
jgi:hypothetical protein